MRFNFARIRLMLAAVALLVAAACSSAELPTQPELQRSDAVWSGDLDIMQQSMDGGSGEPTTEGPPSTARGGEVVGSGG